MGPDVFIAPNAFILGDVEMGALSSAFFGAVLRGDINPIKIGEETNLQEHAIVHTTRGRTPTIIGRGVTVGHGAIIHGPTIEDYCIIGMGSIILDEAVIGTESLVGAGTLVTEGKVFPPRSLILGSPGKVIRSLTDEEIAHIRDSAASYVIAAAGYREIYGTAPIQ